MWALIYKEFVQMRNYLLQVGLVIIIAIILFGQSLEGFILPYLGVLPLVMAMTLPQMVFSLEERGNTLVYLRSLPVRPQQIVASKFVVSLLIVLGLMVIQLGYAITVGRVASVLGSLGLNLIIAALLLGLSLYLHFRLGTNKAKVALLISLMVLTVSGMALMQSPQIANWFASSHAVAAVTELLSTPQGSILGLGIATAILLLFYGLSAAVFSRQDVSRIP